MALQGFTISGLPGVGTPANELPGALFEVEVPVGPVAGGYVNKKLTTEQYVAYLLQESSFVTLLATKADATSLPQFYDQLSAFPNPGVVDVVYVARTARKFYQWTTDGYAELSPAPPVSFATLTGLPTDNQPLADALAAKADLGDVPASTDALPEGSTNYYFTFARSLQTKFAGYAKAAAARALTADDTAMTAAQVLEKRADDLQAVALTPAQKAAQRSEASATNQYVVLSDLKATTVDYDTAKAWQAARSVPTNGLYKITIGSTYLFFTRASEGYFSLLGLRTSLVGNSPLPAFINFTSGNVYPLLSNGTGTKVLSDAGTYVPLPDGTGTSYDDTAVKASIFGRARGVWAPNTLYKLQDWVTFQGLTYYAKTEFTSGASFDASKWTGFGWPQSPPVILIDANGNTVGYDSGDAALAQSSNKTMVLNTDITVTTANGRSPNTIYSNGRTIYVANGVALALTAGSSLVNTNIDFNTSGGSATVAVAGGGGTANTSAGALQLVNSRIYPPITLDQAALRLHTNSLVANALGNGNAYLYDSSSVTAHATGVVVTQPAGSGGSGTLATGTYTAQNAGAQAITVAGATAFFDVNLRATNGQAYALSNGTGYTVSGNTLSILTAANVQAGGIVEYAYLTGAAPSPGGGPSYTGGTGITVSGGVIASKFVYAALRYETQQKIVYDQYRFGVPLTLILSGSDQTLTGQPSPGYFTIPETGYYGIKGHMHMVFPNEGVYCEAIVFVNNSPVGNNIISFSQITPKRVNESLVLGSEQIAVDVYLTQGTTVCLGYTDGSGAGSVYPRSDAPGNSCKLSIIRLA